MKQSFLDVEVLIWPSSDEMFNVRVSSDQGGQGNADLKLPFTRRDIADSVFGAEDMSRAIGSARSGPAGDSAITAERAGVALFEALFQGPALEVLVKAEEAAARMQADVRIRLSMNLDTPGMAAVASLPWELMGRRNANPLVLAGKRQLVRSVDSPGSLILNALDPPLRILVLMSNPAGAPPLDLAAEKAAIDRSWGAMPGVDVKYVDPVYGAVRDALRDQSPHVVHFMGHGDYDPEEGGLLLFETGDGGRDPVSGRRFARLLADSYVRLVFLNACKTAATDAGLGINPFAGVATALLKNDAPPAVVAMQFPISDQAAVAFSEDFYKSIARGLPVDKAVALGRSLLGDGARAEWAIPVLYMRSKDGQLFQEVSGPNAVAAAPPAGTMSAIPVEPRLAAPPPDADDPWGAGSPDDVRVFLATPEENLQRTHRQLARALREQPGVLVVDVVPQDDRRAHDETVEVLARRADLCVHLLGASPGRNVDWGDEEDTLDTYPLAQLGIGLKMARSQLVIMTGEDRRRIGDDRYEEEIRTLGETPRDKARLELQVIDRTRIADAVLEKLQSIREARRAASAAAGPAVQTVFIDAHSKNTDSAAALWSYLRKRKIAATMNTTSSSALTPEQLTKAVTASNLYIIISGGVDPDWVDNRTLAVMKAAGLVSVPLVLGEYDLPPETESSPPRISASRFTVTAALNDSDPNWAETLFAPDAGQDA